MTPKMNMKDKDKNRKLTPTQLHLLKLFAYNDSEEFAKEIQEAIMWHFQKKLDAEMDRLWNEGIINQEKLEDLRHTDFHAKK